MPEIKDFQAGASKPESDRRSGLAPWQQFLFTWQWPITFGPLVTVIALSLTTQLIIPKPWRIAIVLLTTAWFVFFKGYLLYLNNQK
jgi:hypothetical protein